MSKQINGFSRLSKSEKINWLTANFFSNEEKAKQILQQYWNSNTDLQNLHDEFIENTISNFYLPLGIAPNFLINEKSYAIPMVIEESSVVAAASNAAKFWSSRGGFRTQVLQTLKNGQVHFIYAGTPKKIEAFFTSVKPKLVEAVKPITAKMEKRGGGVVDIVLKNKTNLLPNYYQLFVTFDTQDAMGANFINSCLEQFATTLVAAAKNENLEPIDIIMSILSNYAPECLVEASVSCSLNELPETNFNAQKFVTAVTIAKVEPYRAVTHNKGIMNGIDAVVLATGNDFRAVEAGVHAYAARNGVYSSLSEAKIEANRFTFSMKIPLALGTVGGLTKVHPLVQFSLELLGQPNAKKLMQIVAAVGLAQNFAAIRSLTTTGIQAGHMKMHLKNILIQLGATSEEKKKLRSFFNDKAISVAAVKTQLDSLRNA